jgi:chromosome segregation ATPase
MASRSEINTGNSNITTKIQNLKDKISNVLSQSGECYEKFAKVNDDVVQDVGKLDAITKRLQAQQAQIQQLEKQSLPDEELAELKDIKNKYESIKKQLDDEKKKSADLASQKDILTQKNADLESQLNQVDSELTNLIDSIQVRKAGEMEATFNKYLENYGKINKWIETNSK